MKKLGILVFVVALIVGIVVSNVFSFGKIRQSFFNISMNWGGGVKGSGNSATEKRDISGFKGVETSGIFQVEIVAQKDFSVEVEADDNLLPLIRTEVSDGVLKISSSERISPKSKLRVRISAPDIEDVDASGASKISVDSLNNSKIAIHSSGASKIVARGTTRDLNVKVSGASSIDAEGLQAENADLDASGASKISVNASNEIKADASGASKITYAAGAKNVIKKSSGASKITEN